MKYCEYIRTKNHEYLFNTINGSLLEVDDVINLKQKLNGEAYFTQEENSILLD